MFFQNPFASDYMGSWPLGDRQYSISFKCPINSGRSDAWVTSWEKPTPTFDLSGNDPDGNPIDTLTIVFAHNTDLFKNWATLAVDIGGAAVATTSVNEIVANLNADATFASYFTAEASKDLDRVLIRQTFVTGRFRFYIQNGGAETKLRFNARAGVAELPSYFMRHTVGGTYRFDFRDAQNCLVYLDPNAWASLGDSVAGDVIYYATDVKGISLDLDPTTIKEDYELLEGRSGLFTFQKNTVDGSDRITEIIEYPAGAKTGDLARKICYSYTDANKSPDQITEIPYTLTDSDLILPSCSGGEG